MRQIRDALVAAGHVVTSRWINGEHEMFDGDDKCAMQFANEDLVDLHAASMLVCFTDAANAGRARGGLHVEFGYALGMGLPVAIVGPRINVFHHLSRVEYFRDVPDFLSKYTGGSVKMPLLVTSPWRVHFTQHVGDYFGKTKVFRDGKMFLNTAELNADGVRDLAASLGTTVEVK